jgi:NADH-quinone oxidoreductase subunit C
MTPEELTAELIQVRIAAAVPACATKVILNSSPSAQHSLLIDPAHAIEVARFLRDDEDLSMDFCSNVTGVDWLPSEISEKVKVKKMVDGVEQESEEVRKTVVPGYLEVVFHLYSMKKKHGPVILRMRTEDRAEKAHLPSMTSVWRAAEYQEREIFDLYGVIFDGHPDLRRILMWDGFVDHPMRRDYVDPDDFEYEPTAHDNVLKRAQHSNVDRSAAE